MSLEPTQTQKPTIQSEFVRLEPRKDEPRQLRLEDFESQSEYPGKRDRLLKSFE